MDEAWCGYAREGATVGNERSIALAGPLATVALGICFAIPAYVVGDLSSVLFWIPAAGLSMCAIGSMGELMPFTYRIGRRDVAYRLGHRGMDSDGRTLMKLRGRADGESV